VGGGAEDLASQIGHERRGLVRTDVEADDDARVRAEAERPRGSAAVRPCPLEDMLLCPAAPHEIFADSDHGGSRQASALHELGRRGRTAAAECVEHGLRRDEPNHVRPDLRALALFSGFVCHRLDLLREPSQ
jgi:hypothetical protein